MKRTVGRRPKNTPTMVLLLGCLVPLWVSCASERFARPSKGVTQRGMASWYGKDFHGKPTASGEIYDMHQETAAHRELPLHTWIEVVNLDNGRKIKVRVNDRGPFVRGRILDLSYGAARKLGMVQAGLARVQIRVLEVGRGLAGPSRFSRYTVQLGAFGEYRNAVSVRERAAADFPEVEIRSEEGLHRVRIGSFSARADAEELRQRLERRGFDAIVIPLS